MSSAPDLYSAVKPDLGTLAGPLVERSEKLLLEHGDFLPHAAVLSDEGRVSLLGAMCSSQKGFANSWHILPMIYDGLRGIANERELRAVGVAACVEGIPGFPLTRAIRVFIEHRLAFTIAFYLPFSINEDGRYEFGRTISVQADPEIKVWTQGF
jgi:hypothetical protein